MKVKVIDANHEKDLEKKINEFLKSIDGKAIDIKKRTRGDGENLIEDFMIAANETVATHISNMELPFIYRIHALPNAEKIEDFQNFYLKEYSSICKICENGSGTCNVHSQLPCY